MEPLIREADPPFSFAISRTPLAVVVTLHGEVDRASVEPLERALRDLIDDQGNLAVIVDLGDVTRLDTAALDLFETALSWARAHHASFRLLGPD